MGSAAGAERYYKQNNNNNREEKSSYESLALVSLNNLEQRGETGRGRFL